MPKHSRANATGKRGLTFVRSVVEGAQCLFHKIEQENDLGIDGIIEVIRNDIPLNKQFAVQIKTGESYFDSARRQCVIPVGDHRGYWSHYPLPVYGIVVVPSQQTAFWVDIKSYLSEHPDSTAVRFAATEANTFDDGHFASFFIPIAVREVPDIPLDQALRLLQSEHHNENAIGVVVLFRRFCNRREAWDALVEYFRTHASDEVPEILIHFFAHVPWHEDLFGFGEQLTDSTRTYIRDRFSSFGKMEVVKLLSFVDEQSMIARGTVGQSVEAVVHSLPNCWVLLTEILDDSALPMHTREVAGLILAMHWPDEALPLLQRLADGGSQYMRELVAHVSETGSADPYA